MCLKTLWHETSWSVWDADGLRMDYCKTWKWRKGDKRGILDVLQVSALDGAFREYTICMEGRPLPLNLVFQSLKWLENWSLSEPGIDTHSVLSSWLTVQGFFFSLVLGVWKFLISLSNYSGIPKDTLKITQNFKIIISRKVSQDCLSVIWQ